MKHILVIDDERLFPSLETEETKVTYARTSDAASTFLRVFSHWDEVWFDHDLGPDDDASLIVRQMTDSTVSWDKRITKAFVHSMNPVGAENLVNKLKDFGIETKRVPLPPRHTVIE